MAHVDDIVNTVKKKVKIFEGLYNDSSCSTSLKMKLEERKKSTVKLKEIIKTYRHRGHSVKSNISTRCCVYQQEGTKMAIALCCGVIIGYLINKMINK